MRTRTHLAVLGTALSVSMLLAPSATAAQPSFELASVAGFDSLVRLAPDATGADVERLQSALTRDGFLHSGVTGVFDEQTATAVLAFHKFLGLPRETTFNALDWIRIDMLPDPEIPDRWYEPDRVEVDISRQLMFVIRNGEITGILPVSTGGGYTYLSVRSGQAVAAHTPRGDFQLMWRQYGWNCDRTTGWCVYNYWAFTPFYGIHGYHDVPAYPASHGCTRVNTWDSDWLDSQLYVGMPVHVWDEPPSVAPRPPPPAHPTA
jgi:N-acetylmuramoyl-L-alanine amidase